jgi:hypothetical protein
MKNTNGVIAALVNQTFRLYLNELKSMMIIIDKINKTQFMGVKHWREYRA